MVFASLLFVFLFLVANILSQLFIRSVKGKNIAMLVFSLIFYSWSGPRYLILLVGMVFICWVGALVIEGNPGQKQRKTALAVTVALCLVILGIFKYTGFLVSTFAGLFHADWPIPRIVLPIGISFYTFQLISYVVDVYRKQVKAQTKYWMLLLYASLFHQCIAGPIVRYQDIQRDIVTRKPTLAEISTGVTRFTVGLAKKAILANGCAAIADQFFDQGADALAQVPALGILLAAFAFTLQIYLDFSAYSDMAIGMGLMCGFHYKENFNYPYISQSISEFWRRWHISLGSFFRDYVYIPLGGNRVPMVLQLRNLFVVWFLTGLWHGASWNFVLWGLFFGVLIGIERFVLKGALSGLPAPVKAVGVFLLVMFSWILFKFTDFTLMATAVKGLFGLNGNGLTSVDVALAFKNNVFFLIFCTIASTPVGRGLRNLLKNLSLRSRGLFWLNGVVEIAIPVLLLLLAAAALAGDSYNPFLYFRF